MDTDSMWYVALSVGVFVMSMYLFCHCKKIEYPTRFRMETQRHIQTQTE